MDSIMYVDMSYRTQDKRRNIMADHTKEVKYRYNDVKERYTMMNKFYIASTTAMWALFLLFMWLKLNASAIQPIVVYGNTVLIAIF